MLEISSLTKDFYSKGTPIHALRDITLAVKENEFVSFVGPSGCGKTTILRILGGQEKATNGQIRIDGKVVRGASEHIGFVFQSPNLLPWKSNIDNVMLPLKYFKQDIKEGRKRALELFELVGLKGFEDKYPEELSGGMRQRVGIARALIHRPKILLMDEPFGALDALTRTKLDFLIMDIWEKRRTTICFVTHNIGEAVLVSDRIFVMKTQPGEIIEVVDVDFSRPRAKTLLRTPQYLDFIDRIENTIKDYYDI